eukprot:UN06775
MKDSSFPYNWTLFNSNVKSNIFHYLEENHI